MTQTTTGLRVILGLPAVYNLAMSFFGATRARKILVDEYLRIRPGDRVLDIGCGTGAILESIPENTNYFGIDLSEEYIAAARQRFGTRAQFQVGDAAALELQARDPFDIVLAVGLLHHVEDLEVRKLAASVRDLLAGDGRFVTLDNCFISGQNPIARTLIEWDRGQNVRTPEQYSRLLAQEFDEVSFDVRHDLLRVPYTHVIVEAQMAAADAA